MNEFILPSITERNKPGKQTMKAIVKSLQVCEENLMEGLKIMDEINELHKRDGVITGMSISHPTPLEWDNTTNKLNEYLNRFRTEKS